MKKLDKKIPLNRIDNSLFPFISILLIITVTSLLNTPILATLWRYSFDDGTYSHAYLIPLIVGYLFYALSTAKKLIFRDTISWFALTILLLSAYLLFVTSTAQISVGYWLATLLLLCAAINFLFKPSFKVLFPALYFIFLIPVWGLLSTPLQSLSVFAVNALMGLTSIPVFVENQFVHIPSGIFEIAGGCSGLRYLLTSLAISSLYIFLYLRTVKNTIIFAAIAIFGALLTNWLRIAILIIIGHQTEMTSSLMEDHNMFGWYLYAPFMLLLFKLGGYLTDKEHIIIQESDPTSNHISSYAPNNNSNILSWPLSLLLITILSLSSTGLKQIFTSDTIKKGDSTESLTVKPNIYNFSAVDIIVDNNSTTQLLYKFNGNSLEGKPTFFDNNLIPNGWHSIRKEFIETQQIITIQKGIKKAVLTISYEIDGKHIATIKQFKKERLKKALFGYKETTLHWQFDKIENTSNF
ncbi:MAG: exosortase [Colwellia sp.]